MIRRPHSCHHFYACQRLQSWAALASMDHSVAGFSGSLSPTLSLLLSHCFFPLLMSIILFSPSIVLNPCLSQSFLAFCYGLGRVACVCFYSFAFKRYLFECSVFVMPQYYRLCLVVVSISSAYFTKHFVKALLLYSFGLLGAAQQWHYLIKQTCEHVSQHIRQRAKLALICSHVTTRFRQSQLRWAF